MSVFRKPLEAEKNPHASVYVGNLDPQVLETLLYELFIQAGPVRLLHLPKDRILREHQGFGFVEFRTAQDADYAVELFRGVRLFGRTLKMKKTDPQSTTETETLGLSVGARLFVGNLNPLVDEQYLRETFNKFGALVGRPVLARDENGTPKGHGFVEFSDFESSDDALSKMNGAILMNSRIKVEYAYKDGDKHIRHGDEVERLLAQQAKINLKDKRKPRKRKK